LQTPVVIKTITNTVAKQIVQLAQKDKTIVGVMGWPFSGYAIDAIKVLAAARIPMLSQTASSDALTNISTTSSGSRHPIDQGSMSEVC